MADLAELEKRLHLLETEVQKFKDIDAICRLKYKYWRCLDKKLWDQMKECFSEDITTDYSDGKYRLNGPDEIIDFLRNRPGRDIHLSAHQGHHPEIELTSHTTATGVWALHDHVIDRYAGLTQNGGAHYYDEYIKQNGEWKIKHTGYTRLFEEKTFVNGPQVSGASK